MDFELKYRILLFKEYFDAGWGNTAPLKYIALILGLQSATGIKGASFIVGYGLFCFVFGYYWYKYGWREASMEIGNRYNMFVKEMRTHIAKPKSI